MILEPCPKLITQRYLAFTTARRNVFLEPEVTMSTSERNGKAELHPTTSELSILSRLVYEYRDWLEVNIKEDIKSSFVEYAIQKCCQNENTEEGKAVFEQIREFETIYGGREKDCGFSAVCFHRKKSDARHPQVVIVFEGTNKDPAQFKADIDAIVKNKWTPIINTAITFTLRFLEEFMGESDMDHSKLHLTITGHSLGGFLAQFSTFATNNAQVLKNPFTVEYCAKRKDNGDIHAHCEVFDSPGAHQMLVGLCQHILNNQNRRIDSDVALSQLDISNFVLKPNSVNTVNMFVGEKYLLTYAGQEKSSTLRGSNDFHKIKYVIDAIQKCGGENVKDKLVTKWPIVVYEGYTTETPSMSTKGGTIEKYWFGFKQFFNPLQHTEIEWKENVAFELQERDTVSISFLSKRERFLLKYLEVIITWEKLFQPDCFSPVDQCLKRDLKLLVDDLKVHSAYMIEHYGYVKLSNRKHYLLFKNMALASSELKAAYDNQTDFKTAYYITESCIFIKCIRSEYISLQSSVEPSVLKKQNFYFGDRATAELFMLYIARCIDEELNEMNKKNTLILRYTQFTRWGGEQIDSKFTNIFIDCLNCHEEVTSQVFPSRVKFVKLSKTRRSEAVTVSDVNMEELLNHKLKIQGRSYVLKTWFDLGKSEILKFLNDILNDRPSDKDNMYIFKKWSDYEVNVVEKLPTIYDDLGMYFEPNQTFQSLEVLLNHFTEGLFYYTRDDLTEGFKAQLNQHCQLIDSLTDHIESFQARCKTVSHMANLLEVSRSADDRYIIHWVLHFNNKFLQTRHIMPPPINLTCMDFSDVALAINVESSIDKTVDVFQSFTVFKTNIKTHLRELFQGNVPEEYNSIVIGQSADDDELYTITFQMGSKIVLGPLAIPCDSKVNTSEKALVSYLGNIILADQPGMGKTISMLKLASDLVKNRCYWVLFKELKQFEFPKPEISKIVSEEQIRIFLKDNLIKNGDLLARYVFDYNFKNHSEKLAFLFEGFDELPSVNEKKIMLYVLKFLRTNKKSKIIVSTRTHERNDLQVALGVLSHRFVPLQNYKEILRTSWDGLIKWTTFETEKYDIFCDYIQKKIKDVVTDNINVVGVPLHLKMISEVFVEKVKEFVHNTNDNVDVLPKTYTLTELYQQYIKRKYQIYFNQKLLIRKEFYYKLDQLITSHEIATQALAPDAISIKFDIFEKLYWDTYKIPAKRENTELYDIGIVKPHPQSRFIHRSVAEFYIAKFLYFVFKTRLNELDSASPKSQQTLFDGLKEMLLPIDRFVIRNFLEEFICDDEEIFKKIKDCNLKCLVHKDVYCESTEVVEYIEKMSVRFLKNIYLLLFLLQTIVNDLDNLTHLIRDARFTFLSIFLPVRQTKLHKIILLANLLKRKTGKEWTTTEFLCYPDSTQSFDSFQSLTTSNRDPILAAFQDRNENWVELLTDYLNNLVNENINFDMLVLKLGEVVINTIELRQELLGKEAGIYYVMEAKTEKIIEKYLEKMEIRDTSAKTIFELFTHLYSRPCINCAPVVQCKVQ